ncbi:MAG: TIGR01906 family membrane protein [Bacillota bacterium]
MNRSFLRLAISLMVASLIVLGILLPIHLVGFNLGFYRSQWERLGVTADTGMTMEDLGRSASTLLQYFTGKAETPQLTVTVNGQERPLYNPKEMTHLADVKTLFNYGFMLEQVLAAEVLGLGLFLRKARESRALSRSLSLAGGILLGALLTLIVAARTNFTGFWTNFHLLTFTNDLWLLDPATDWLVRIYPEGFFLAAVERVGIIASGISLLYLVSGLLVRHFAADNRH